MSQMTEAVERYQKARMEGRLPDPPRFWWFDPAVEAAYIGCVMLHGAQNVRTECHLALDEDEKTITLWRRVVDRKTGKVLGEFNVSHPCPPNCPLKAAEEGV